LRGKKAKLGGKNSLSSAPKQFFSPSEGKTVRMRRGVGTASPSFFGGVDVSVGGCSIGCWENETTNASAAKVNV
jgi:hypothetical protein